jgi:hypothetical protein
LKPKCGEPLANFAFKFHLRRYNTVSFRTNIAQNYVFEITLNGVPIANSPAGAYTRSLFGSR